MCFNVSVFHWNKMHALGLCGGFVQVLFKSVYKTFGLFWTYLKIVKNCSLDSVINKEMHVEHIQACVIQCLKLRGTLSESVIPRQDSK